MPKIIGYAKEYAWLVLLLALFALYAYHSAAMMSQQASMQRTIDGLREELRVCAQRELDMERSYSTALEEARDRADDAAERARQADDRYGRERKAHEKTRGMLTAAFDGLREAIDGTDAAEAGNDTSPAGLARSLERITEQARRLRFVAGASTERYVELAGVLDDRDLQVTGLLDYDKLVRDFVRGIKLPACAR